MWFETCDWGEDEPWTWGITIANSWRIHADHLPLWWGAGGTANIIESFANKSAYAGVIGDNVYASDMRRHTRSHTHTKYNAHIEETRSSKLLLVSPAHRGRSVAGTMATF